MVLGRLQNRATAGDAGAGGGAGEVRPAARDGRAGGVEVGGVRAGISSVEDLCSHIAATKSLVGPLAWRPAQRDDRVTSAVEIEAVISQGITFCATCMRAKPNENVTILLLAEIQGKPRPFARVDWRGSAHNNNSPYCRDIRFLDAGRNHFHDPRLHIHMTLEELYAPKVDLPAALPLSREPQNFQELMEISGALLHIANMNLIPEPPWPPQTSFLPDL